MKKLPPLFHLAACHRAKDCDACREVVNVLQQLEEQVCTCPPGSRRGGLVSHLEGCPAAIVDALRLRLDGQWATVSAKEEAA